MGIEVVGIWRLGWEWKKVLEGFVLLVPGAGTIIVVGWYMWCEIGGHGYGVFRVSRSIPGVFGMVVPLIVFGPGVAGNVCVVIPRPPGIGSFSPCAKGRPVVSELWVVGGIWRRSVIMVAARCGACLFGIMVVVWLILIMLIMSCVSVIT